MNTAISQSHVSKQETYEQAVQPIWRHTTPPTDARALQRELVRYATLAASSHNTQCWKFKLEERQIEIWPDFERRCPAVDPDDRHLHVSLGCAIENLVQAAQAFGLRGSVDLQSTDVIAICSRVRTQVTVGRGAGGAGGERSKIYPYSIVRSDCPNLTEYSYIKIQLGSTQPMRSQLCEAIPERAYQRFALQAAALGIRTAFLNQPVEVAVLRPQFANYLEIGDRRPD